MTRKQSHASGRKQLSTKWAFAVVVAVVAYGLIQPLVNVRLDWELPSLASWIGQGDSLASSNSQDSSAASNKSESWPSVDDQRREASPKPRASSTTVLDAETIGTFGYLREVGELDFLSPGGLRFTRGSQEGHRLKHLARHLKDQPDRPGLHGVFRGDMNQVLRWLDDAYERAKSGAEGTSQRDEQGRIVYEAEFAEPIGFVGGQQGRRNGNPDAKDLRLVTEGNRVITAFPF